MITRCNVWSTILWDILRFSLVTGRTCHSYPGVSSHIQVIHISQKYPAITISEETTTSLYSATGLDLQPTFPSDVTHPICIKFNGWALICLAHRILHPQAEIETFANSKGRLEANLVVDVMLMALPEKYRPNLHETLRDSLLPLLFERIERERPSLARHKMLLLTWFHCKGRMSNNWGSCTGGEPREVG